MNAAKRSGDALAVFVLPVRSRSHWVSSHDVGQWLSPCRIKPRIGQPAVRLQSLSDSLTDDSNRFAWRYVLCVRVGGADPRAVG